MGDVKINMIYIIVFVIFNGKEKFVRLMCVKILFVVIMEFVLWICLFLCIIVNV